MTDAHKSLHELREYFEQKRDLAIRNLGHAKRSPVYDNGNVCEQVACQTEANAYDHAMDMVAAYILDEAKP